MLNDIQKIALSKIKFDRDNVPSGDHGVDFTVRVRGSVKVGDDYEKRGTTSIPWLESVALWQETIRAAFDGLLAKMDAGELTREEIVAMQHSGPVATGVLVDCIRTAMLNGESAVGTIQDRVEEVKMGVDRVQREVVSNLPMQQAKGHVKVSVEVTDLTEAANMREAAAVLNPRQIREAV